MPFRRPLLKATLFGQAAACSACGVNISASEYVMRAGGPSGGPPGTPHHPHTINVFHVKCFTCNKCGIQLMPGDSVSRAISAASNSCPVIDLLTSAAPPHSDVSPPCGLIHCSHPPLAHHLPHSPPPALSQTLLTPQYYVSSNLRFF
ncbi:insulin gene enhancer protein isl-2a-like [Diaphorina citri]|uniref:Insulin gene enhancer protein isl-2a-like n=1 Tax=Diaphorina citri TaxID=121845 RepID=A0A1S4EAW9_DIACI|nr:insulin gene enhancer protein isl-2a-like [Diaphorina citri]